MTKSDLIFTEFCDTARYLYKLNYGKQVSRILNKLIADAKMNREEIIERFSPCYNGKSPDKCRIPVQTLITTDILAEGLNLQDASIIINYDLTLESRPPHATHR